MARRQLRSQALAAPEEPLLNVTPLIDVVFVLLISFMVVAPLLEHDRIELASGDSISSHLPIRMDDASPIQIHVYENNTIAFNSTPTTLNELTRLLQEAKRLHPGARAQLFHHKRAHFGTYQSVKNALESAQFKEMDVVLVP